MMSEDPWDSYNSTAETYASVSVPIYFQRPATDLVLLMELNHTDRLLDVGSGSGVVCNAALQTGLQDIFAVDPALEMLKQAAIANRVCAYCPGVPFASQTFDAVTAAFVLTHIHNCHSALQDMKRVLKPKGKIGICNWIVISNEFSKAWQEIAERLTEEDFFHDCSQIALPWEQLLSDPEQNRRILETSGFGNVCTAIRDYECSVNIDAYLKSRELSMMARYVRNKAGNQAWQKIRTTAADEFHKRFQDPLQFRTTVVFALGRMIETTEAPRH